VCVRECGCVPYVWVPVRVCVCGMYVLILLDCQVSTCSFLPTCNVVCGWGGRRVGEVMGMGSVCT